MSGWNNNKRFWKEVTCQGVDGGFTVLLDERAIKTPAKAALIVPTLVMAQAIAAEWDAQGEEIKPLTMPTTRSANAAIDKVAIQHAEVADMIAEYGGTDLLCYRATSPEELVMRQVESWDPLLSWAADALGASLRAVAGVMHIQQDQTSLAALRTKVHMLTNFELAAFHDLVSLSGSLVIGFAQIQDARPTEELWDSSRVDETWQEQLWGLDDEASALTATKRAAFIHAANFYKLAQV